jgi:hypothetical protein
MRASPKDTFEQFGPNVFAEAYKRGMSVSAYLEMQDPSTAHDDGLDAFQRVVRVAGVRTTGLDDIGMPASSWDEFNNTPQKRALAMEWAARQWRSASTGRPYHTRDLYSSADLANTAGNPAAYATGPRYAMVTPAIPVRELIATNTGISAGTYQAYYLTTPAAADTRQYRVAELAEIPMTTLAGGDHTVKLHKVGRGLESSYEAMRRQPIDKVAIWIQYLAAQAEADKLTAIIDVLVSGDGNTSTAATNYNLTALDTAASAGTLTLKGWLAFKMKFTNPMSLTHILVQEAVALQLSLLNVGNANVPLVNIQAQAGFGSLTAINPQLRDAVAMGWTSSAPSLKIVGFDRRLAVERVYEVGGNIQEVERYASHQGEALYLTEVEAFCTFMPGANFTLNVNA